MNKDVFAVIIEDEIPAARLLYSMVKRIRPSWNVEVLPGNIEECVKWFEANKCPDLIFLDIQLSDGNSFDLLDQVRPNSSIIFTTAYDQYAIQAFTVNSIDYILKPIDEQRLIEAIEKFESQKSLSPLYLETILESLSSNSKKYRTRFLIATVKDYLTLQVNDTALFYSENKVTYAFDKTGNKYPLDLTLEKLQEQLDPDMFFRANRQIIVSINCIKRVEPYFGGKLILITNPNAPIQIIISKEKVPRLKQWLNF